jgi:hypothetical protein
MNTHKLCVSCRWFALAPASQDAENANCKQPSLQKTSLVTGKIEMRFCGNERQGMSACGPDANLFEPKPEKTNL